MKQDDASVAQMSEPGVSPEAAGSSPAAGDLPDMATIKHVVGYPTVSWTCPECSSPVTVAGNRLLPLVVSGQGAVVKCPAEACGKFVAVDGRRPDAPLVKPARAMNREARRAIDSLARRGLIQPR